MILIGYTPFCIRYSILCFHNVLDTTHVAWFWLALSFCSKIWIIGHQRYGQLHNWLVSLSSDSFWVNLFFWLVFGGSSKESLSFGYTFWGLSQIHIDFRWRHRYLKVLRWSADFLIFTMHHKIREVLSNIWGDKWHRWVQNYH